MTICLLISCMNSTRQNMSNVGWIWWGNVKGSENVAFLLSSAKKRKLIEKIDFFWKSKVVRHLSFLHLPLWNNRFDLVVRYIYGKGFSCCLLLLYGLYVSVSLTLFKQRWCNLPIDCVEFRSICSFEHLNRRLYAQE